MNKLLSSFIVLAALAVSANAAFSLSVTMTPVDGDSRWTDKTTEWVPMRLTLTNIGTVAATGIEWDFVSTAPGYTRLWGDRPTSEFVIGSGESFSWDAGFWCRSADYFPGYANHANLWDLQTLYVNLEAKNIKELSLPAQSFQSNSVQYNVVPEPSTYAALMFGIVPFIKRKRR